MSQTAVVLLTIFTCLVGALSVAAEDLTVLGDKLDGVAPPDMVHAYLLGKTHAALDRRKEAFEKLKTPEEVAAYQKRMREFFVEQLGGFPERTPLDARVVERMDRDGYRIEKVIYQSRPRLYVTALLYLPDAKPPYPGVLVPCGHSGNGKANEPYQRACILLAKNGMAALCYDPIEQGERYQLLDEKGKPILGGTQAHSMVGVGSILLGRNTATFRVWDGIRGIDYLAGREEIDPKRIGCTGNSGGGTLTAYLMALDERIACAAPSCYLTSLGRLMDTIGPQDAEQNIHAQIAFGMDHADYVHMRAAKPTLMCTATRDFFDIGGSWDTFREAKRLYGRLGFAERVDLVENDAEHGFNSSLRVAAVRWMRRWLLGVDDAITEPDFPILTDQEATCTPRGQVMLLDGARSTYDLNLDLESQLAEKRKKFWKETAPADAMAEVRRITGIRKLADLPEPKVEKAGQLPREGYRVEKLILKPEPGIALPALAFVPETKSGDAYLYLNAEGKQADAAPGGPIEKLVKAGNVVLAVDLRGLGETQPAGKEHAYDDLLGKDWRDVSIAYMLDTSYLAMRAEDVLVCARFLATYEAGAAPNRVHLASIGLVGPPALHAAALEPRCFASVSLARSLANWSDLLRAPLAKQQYVHTVHGALKCYDLPDLLGTLPADKVTVSEAVNVR
jgi:dienelactone hydrolase